MQVGTSWKSGYCRAWYRSSSSRVVFHRLAGEGLELAVEEEAELDVPASAADRKGFQGISSGHYGSL